MLKVTEITMRMAILTLGHPMVIVAQYLSDGNRGVVLIPKASTLPSWLANSTPQPWHSSGSEYLLFCIQMGLDQDLPLPNSPQNPTPPLLGLALQL